jgi:hypothetical protein
LLKNNFGLLTTIALKVVTYRAYGSFPGILQFLNVSKTPFQFYLQSGKRRKVSVGQVMGTGWLGTRAMLLLLKILLVKD